MTLKDYSQKIGTSCIYKLSIMEENIAKLEVVWNKL